jgi:hypothetical protein
VVGGALATSGLLLPSNAGAVASFESAGVGEERLPQGLRPAAPGPQMMLSSSSVGAPTIITRAEWGADESIRTSGRAFTPIRKLIVHHTASANRPSNPAEVVREVYEDHVRNRGFADIGYNFLVDHRGNVYEGRWARHYAPGEVHSGEGVDGLGVMGAHALGVNAGSCGIVLIGNFMTGRPSSAAIYALTQLLAWKAARHQIDAWKSDRYVSLFGAPLRFPNIAVHRNVGMTLCPGNGVVRRMDGVRGSVAALAGSFPSQTADLAASIRYTGGQPAITPATPSGNDVRRGHTSSSSNQSTTTSQATETSTQTSTTSVGSLVAYRVLSAGGHLRTLGDASRYGSPAGRGATGTVAIAPGPDQSFWTLDRAGRVLSFGAAATFGDLSTMGDSHGGVDIEGLPGGSGYWILTGAGGVWAFGAAGWYGSLARSGASTRGLRIHATPSGQGYWILGRNGGMYIFGDAQWYGSALRRGVSGAVDFWPTPSGHGYWVLIANGSVLSFGDAPELGNMGSLGISWRRPAVAILGTPNGRGYNVLTGDGGVYAFGDAPFFGSLAGSGRTAVGIAPVVS